MVHMFAQRKETYVIIGLGADLDKKPANGDRLQSMACNGKGIYSQGESPFARTLPCIIDCYQLRICSLLRCEHILY
jgi:hypothetical protein